MGISISFAGIAIMYASKIIPFNPKINAAGFDQLIKCSAILILPILILATNQITNPAEISA
ncbi:MAG TPA: hypothetical protein VIH28_11950 [Ignavibacteriaceae bacterium]|nr:MAG: hypothetical protein A2W30_05825 [Ignavibacteria bacterium RBG_16_36_9]